MRLVAVDAEQDVAVDTLLTTLTGLAPTRVFLFGAAARRVGAFLRDEDERLRERFLDDTARHLLSERREERPMRAAIPPVAARLLAVVSSTGGPVPLLESTERAVELRGNSLVMAVPRREALAREVVENASVWIVGGARRREVTHEGNSLVVAPGALDQGGALLVIAPQGNGYLVEDRALSGELTASETITPTQAGPRMSVRG